MFSQTAGPYIEQWLVPLSSSELEWPSKKSLDTYLPGLHWS